MITVTLNRERYEGYVRTAAARTSRDEPYRLIRSTLNGFAEKFADYGGYGWEVEFGDTGDNEPLVITAPEPAGLRVDRTCSLTDLDEDAVRGDWAMLLAYFERINFDNREYTRKAEGNSLLNLEVNVNALAFGPISRVSTREALTSCGQVEKFNDLLRAALFPGYFNDCLRRPAVTVCKVHDVDLQTETVRLTIRYDKRAVKVRELKETVLELVPARRLLVCPVAQGRTVRVTLGRAKVVAPSSCLYGEGIKRPAEDLAS